MVQGYQAVPVVQHHQGGSLRRINSFRGGARNLGSAQGLYTSSPVVQTQGAVGGYTVLGPAVQGTVGGYHQDTMTQGTVGLSRHPQESEPVYDEAGEIYIRNENFQQ